MVALNIKKKNSSPEFCFSFSSVVTKNWLRYEDSFSQTFIYSNEAYWCANSASGNKMDTYAGPNGIYNLVWSGHTCIIFLST